MRLEQQLNRLLRPLAPLDRKLMRDLWHLRGQALAIALVIGCGVAMFIMSIGMIRSLENTRDAYYDRYRFADIWAPVKRAPEYLIHEIRTMPGVRSAETRITVNVVLDVPGMAEPVTGRVHSLPPSGTPRLNAVVLRSGRMVDPNVDDEVLVLEAFAQAHGLVPGDWFHANLKGKRQRLKVAGLVLSPEYVYAIAAGQLLPDPKRFGVLWMGREHLAAAFDLDGAFNEVLAALERGGDKAEVMRRLDLILDRFGGIGAYGRDEHISDEFLSNEMEQLKIMTGILPPIFLGVAAFLLNVVLSRLIETEREQIGLLKAFGYSTFAVGWHYTKMVLLLTGLGVALGFAAGAWLGRGLASIYQDFFVFPFLYFDAGSDVFALGALISMAAALAGTYLAVSRAARLAPAVAMRPPAPIDYSGKLSRRLATTQWLGEPARIVLRHLIRRPGRAALTVLGIAMALGLRIASESSNDNVGRMIELTFDYAQRQDATISLIEPRAGGILHAFSRLPGVMAVEPFRSVPARLKFGAKEKRQGLTGVAPGARMNRLIDMQQQGVDPAPFGVTLSQSLAEQLGIAAGDRLIVEVMEGRRPTLSIPVTALVDVYIGTPAYMDIRALNALMQEGDVINGVYAMVDERQLPALYERLKQTPAVAGLSLTETSIETFNRTMAENLGIMTLINTIFASLIVVGVVYNNARISLSERARDLASLRVLGFKRGEVSVIALGELALLVLASLPLGIAMGMGLSWFIAERFSTDLFIVPYALSGRTVALGVITVLVAAAASALIVRQRIDKLDLIRVLKTRE
ncbi:MAG: ABC transporter permease [Sphingomonadales bacterium]